MDFGAKESLYGLLFRQIANYYCFPSCYFFMCSNKREYFRNVAPHLHSGHLFIFDLLYYLALPLCFF